MKGALKVFARVELIKATGFKSWHQAYYLTDTTGFFCLFVCSGFSITILVWLFSVIRLLQHN